MPSAAQKTSPVRWSASLPGGRSVGVVAAVGVGDGTAVGVRVGDGVSVGGTVAVGVTVGVGVPVGLGVAVAVAVGEGVVAGEGASVGASVGAGVRNSPRAEADPLSTTTSGGPPIMYPLAWGSRAEAGANVSV